MSEAQECTNCNPDYEPSSPREIAKKCGVCGRYSFWIRDLLASSQGGDSTPKHTQSALAGWLTPIIRKSMGRCAHGESHAEQVAHDVVAALLASPAEPKTRDWTEDFGHENGQYVNYCIQCDNDFRGHKRRVVCRLCATSSPPPSGGQR